jgi:hypothetical protein
MKQVILEYAGAVIALLGTFCFLIVFQYFFVGEEGALGQMLKYSVGEKTIAEHEAFDEYKRELPPKIVEKKDLFLVANQRVSLSDYFEAKSNKGDILPVYLEFAWDMDKNETNMGACADKRTICVEKAGIYLIQIYAVDENGKATSQRLKILVNER